MLLWREHLTNGINLIMPTELELEQRRSRGVGEMFRALRHRNFLLFWSGAFLSNTGTWMQAVAQGWLVLQLTDSPFWLGFDGFMSTAPGLLLTLAGGVFADLMDRRKLLINTQIVAGLAACSASLPRKSKHGHTWPPPRARVDTVQDRPESWVGERA